MLAAAKNDEALKLAAKADRVAAAQNAAGLAAVYEKEAQDRRDIEQALKNL